MLEEEVLSLILEEYLTVIESRVDEFSELERSTNQVYFSLKRKFIGERRNAHKLWKLLLVLQIVRC